ncbi:MAG: AraC family transcriptional regulator [Spirochaetaceae bacterium]|jgi:AraC-like DNA-binding protein/mannose-6-phosphate isomerase-like protein (cupin superfamily)|nr:AraC family transcriptional regulator [Spirochaetaceae bacterium]
MKKSTIHRPNTTERTHYIPSQKPEISLYPKLLYAGVLKRSATWREEPHSHAFLEVVFVKSGSGEAVVGGKRYALASGDILIYNAHTLHNEFSLEYDPLEIYFFAAEKIELSGLPKGHLVAQGRSELVHTGEDAEKFAFCFSALAKESQSEAHMAKEMTESLTRATLILILRLLMSDSEQYLKINRLYFKAKTYIDEHFAEINSVDEICRTQHISNYYLTHLFKSHSGTTPLRYLIGKKLELAKTLLKTTTLTARAISLNYGWEDAAYFSKVFKAREKMTPLEYRAANNVDTQSRA